MDPLVVIGGGIAGVTCAKVLSLDEPQLSVILISVSPVVKMVANLKTIGRSIDMFDVIEQNSSAVQCNNLRVINNKVIQLDSVKRHVKLDDNTILKYSKLCICTGAKPKVIHFESEEVKKYIKCIRDTETAKDFQSILSNSKRILIVGNGGIATELIYEVNDCEIIWAIKDNNFGATFFDPAVSKFFSDFLCETPKECSISKRHHFNVDLSNSIQAESNEFGVALGPDWHSGYLMKGQNRKKVTIEKNCHISNVYSFASIPQEKTNKIQNSLANDKWNVYIELSNGHIYGCDMVISATGVAPNSDIFTRDNSFNLCPIGGILIDNEMRTNIKDIYAAGDVCSIDWQVAPNWFQMRLWTQARQMGFYAAKCISAHIQKISPALYFNFDVFTHVTRFFGFRVILLGLYNGQKLTPNDCRILYRVTEKKDLVKVILQNGTMKGAILIGETNYEETFENLIFNQIDLSHFGDQLLEDVLDLEDYFD